MRRVQGDYRRTRIKFVCVDGPEFNGHEVDFDELMMRNRSYLKEEKAAMEEFIYHEARSAMSESAIKMVNF